MPQNFIACDRDQDLLLPPNMREWLASDHLAWFVIEAIEELDLEPFYGAYRSDGHGRAAHDPKMMVALFLYAYAVGERSSRAIERRCREDVAFRVLAANQAPDHATLARFRCRHEQPLGELFSQILELCVKAGIASSKVVALDSTKIAANASGQANRSYEQIAREALQEAAQIDAEEDELHGSQRGDELPEGLRDSVSRRTWLREATRELEAERASSEAPRPATRSARLRAARGQIEADHDLALRADRAHRAERERSAGKDKRPTGAPFSTPPLGAHPDGRANVTDPDSRPVRTHRGFIQGYNAQALASPEQVILACELTQRSADGGELEPMVAAARRELEQAGAEAPGVILADAGYWSKDQVKELQEEGFDPLVPPAGHPPQRAGPRAQMRKRLASERGAELYRRRQAMIEPVFAQVKVNRGIDRFQRRGLAACRAEWRLIAATHNLLKLWRAAFEPAVA